MIVFQSMQQVYRNSATRCKRQTVMVYRNTAHHMDTIERTPFGRRLYEARETAGLSQKDVERAVGIGQSTLSEAEIQGKRSGKVAELAALYGVEALWLAEGKGPKHRPRYTSDLSATPLSAPQKLSRDGAIHPGEGRLAIRRALFKLSAGVSGYEVEYEDGESEPIFMGRRWFESHRYRPERLIAIKVSGRSMEPSLHDGDLVIVNTDDTALKDGEVFAANFEGELVIKRLKREAGNWYLSSDNQDKIRFGDKLCNEGCGLIGRIVYKQSEHI